MWQPAGQQHKQGSVAPGQRWTLCLSFQDDELLPQEHVLQQQFRPAACQVYGCIQGQIMVVRLGPLAKKLSGCLAERVYVLPHERKRREIHGLPFSLEMQATILPRNVGVSHFVERMRIFGQDRLSGPRGKSVKQHVEHDVKQSVKCQATEKLAPILTV
jgi:hypothetical protein